MARGIDHIVHAVVDLDAAAALYRAPGFQVGGRDRHAPSWGTQNHIVQLDGSFIELLTVAEPAGIVPHGPRSFSFGAHNRDALARGEGLSMLVLAIRMHAPTRMRLFKAELAISTCSISNARANVQTAHRSKWLFHSPSQPTRKRRISVSSPASTSSRKFLEPGISNSS